jgi:hypothetical protein
MKAYPQQWRLRIRGSPWSSKDLPWSSKPLPWSHRYSIGCSDFDIFKKNGELRWKQIPNINSKAQFKKMFFFFFGALSLTVSQKW